MARFTILIGYCHDCEGIHHSGMVMIKYVIACTIFGITVVETQNILFKVWISKRHLHAHGGKSSGDLMKLYIPNVSSF